MTVMITVHILVEDVAAGKSFTFHCGQWISADQDGATASLHLQPAEVKDPLPVVPDQKFEMTFFTKCDKPIMSKLADIYFRLFGPKEKNFDEEAFNKSIIEGDFLPPNKRCSPIICIPGEHLKPTGESVVKFQINGCHRLSPSSKLALGHDAPQMSSDWFVEKVMLYCLNTGITQIFHCNKWFPFTEKSTKRKINSQYTVEPSKRPSSSIILKTFTLVTVWLEFTLQDDYIKFDLVVIFNYEAWHYKVIVYTGQQSAEKLSSNVYINIFGTISDSGNRQLRSREAFARGKVDEFVIEAVKLGRLEKVRIGHDGRGPTSKWHLEKIIVEEMEDTDNAIEIDFNDWVDRKQPNGLFEIELYPKQTSEGVNYTLHTVTGEILKADTNATVLISLVGDAGETQFVPLKDSPSPSGPFRLGQEDIFQFQAPFIGKMKMAKILLERKDTNATWYLKKLSLTVNEFSLRYFFNVERWLSLNHNEDKMEFSLQPTSVERLFNVVPYEITFYTGHEIGSGTDALVYLQLYGDRGALRTETMLFNSDGKKFGTGETVTFNVYTSEVGDITKIRVGHNGQGPSANWLLEKIRIRKIATHVCSHCLLELCPNMRLSQKSASNESGKCENSRCSCHLENARISEETPLLTLHNRPHEEFWFFANDWIPPRDVENGQNFCELLPASAKQTPLSDRKKTVYEVRVRTSNESGAGTTSQAYLTFIGETSESGDFVLHNPKGQLLSQGREAIFRLEAIDLGKISKIRLRHDNTGTSPDWHVQDVIVTEFNGVKEREYLFHCNQWLAASTVGSGHLIKEFPVSRTKQSRESEKKLPNDEDVPGKTALAEKNQLPTSNSFPNKHCPRDSLDDANVQVKNLTTALPQPLTYRVSIVTGANAEAGTSSEVYLILQGDKGSTGKIILNNASPTNGVTGKRKFQTGNTDNFLISMPDIGVLTNIRLGHNNSGPSPSWYVDKLEVESKESGSVVEYPCNQWIGKSGQYGDAYVDLSSQLFSSSPFGTSVFYEFKIYTSDVLNAWTDANVFATLTGANGRHTSEVRLNGNFERGEREVLYIKLEDVGEPLQNLRIKHDNSGFNPAWHLDCVEVRPTGSKLSENEAYIFACNRWLSDICGTEVVLNARVGKMRNWVATKGGRKTTYEIAVTTGDIRNAGTTSRVFLSMIDADGRKEERQLTSTKSPKRLFHSGQTDVFVWENVPLNEIRTICLRHDNSGISPAWFIKEVVVSQITSSGIREQIQKFICNRWISYNGEEFTTIPQSSLSSSSPSSSLEDLSTPRNKLSSTPQLNLMSALKSDDLGNIGSLNGSQQRPTLNDYDDGARSNIPPVSMGSFQPVSGSDEEDMLSMTEDEEEVPYKITLETGRHADAGTSGPILMNLVGSNGASTGWLFFQTLTGNTELPAGSHKTFVFSAPPLTEIKAIEIYDQSEKQSGSGWYLKHMVVEIPSRKMTYDIPCDFWVTNRKDGNRAYHRITISPEYLVEKESVVSKERQTFTLKLWLDGQMPPNLGPNIALQIIGNYGVTTDIEVINQDWVAQTRLLMLQFYAKEDVNLISRIKIMFESNSDGERQIDWWISNAILELEDGTVKKRYFFTEWQFNFNQRLSRTCELTSTPPVKPPVTAYKIRVKTSNLPDAGTNADVFIRLLGDKFQSMDIHLKDSESNIKPFEKNQIDQFTISNLPDLGELNGCLLWHDSRMEPESWNCEWIYVTEILPEGSFIPPQSWYFPCNQWIRSDGSSQVVPVDLFPMDIKAAPANALQRNDHGLSPIAEEDDESISAAKKLFHEVEKTEYTVEVETSTAMEAGTDHLGWIIIKGRRGLSPVLELKDSYGSSTLQRGSSKTFSITCEPLGLIQQVYVGLYDPDAFMDDSDEEPKYVNLQLNRHNQWNCRRILVTDSKDGETYVFNIHQWIIATPAIDRYNAIAARPAELRYVRSPASSNFNSSRAPKVTYKIVVETGDMLNAGTTANVYITLYGEQSGATSGSQRLQRTTNQTFAQGRVDTFFVFCAKLG
ncbi:unnamed protein product [Rodentolepis nana]|uniref:PLAT domain-containing protein n=1 Tax=Rodentolepis nana TaxID=102285 RepID=A0A158QHX7_RODNA|nr:unnamed protein product [Rodentolepis nana]